MTANGNLKAIGAAAAVAAVALPLGELLPRLGAPILALIGGIAIAAVAPRPALHDGLAKTGKYGLQASIVLLGATLSLHQVADVGAASLPVMLTTLTAALAGAALLGHRLDVPTRLRALVGVGTAICGASAIAAISGTIQARAAEIRYAISTIFIFNLVAVLAFPPLAHLLGMSEHAFGLWAGTAINDSSSTVAAGFAYGDDAARYGLIVKLTRTLMIIPVALALAAWSGRGASRAFNDAMPWFLLLFLAASAADTLGAFDAGARAAFSHAGLALTTVALAAVGLSTDLGELRRTGPRPLAVGALVWALVATVSLAAQAMFT